MTGSRAMALKERHQRFVEEYCVDFNGAQAAIRAGYSATRANRQAYVLLQREDVQQAIAQQREEIAERVKVSQDWVLRRLVENVERAMQNEPVKDSEGNETGIYTYQGHVANRALELLGKHLGMFKADSPNGEQGLVIRIEYGDEDIDG